MKGPALVAVAVVLAVAGCGSSTPEKVESRIPAAVSACSVSANVLADGGSSATMRSKSSSVSEPTTNLDGMTCVLKRLGVSSAALEHVASTRALDGQQTEEWDGFKARWTFHPDDGLQMTVVDTKAG